MNKKIILENKLRSIIRNIIREETVKVKNKTVKLDHGYSLKIKDKKG